MRWVCHLYPQLPLEVLSPPESQASAVVEPRAHRRPVTFINAAAATRGVQIGMSQSSAIGLVPDLVVLARRLGNEQAALDAMACRAYRFGSPVVIDTDRFAVWVEVASSLKLFGGWQGLAEALLKPDEHVNYTVRIGSAPTLSAALLLAGASVKPSRPVSRLADLPKALAALPLQNLPFNSDSLQMLHGAGLRRIGEVLDLPRSSLGKRIGAANLLSLQRLLGAAPEPWEAWQPATQYRRQFDFSEPIETTEGLLFPLRIVLAEFVAYLKLRDLSIQYFDLKLVDSRKRVVRHPIGLLSPTRDLQRLLLILRERLDHLEMEDGVMAVTVEADRFEPAAAIQDDLFSDISAQLGERLTELRERLSARLGPDVVKQLAVSADQRPEATQSLQGVEPAVHGGEHPDRPLWLLPKPQRILPRRVLTPPERIELGWWDEKAPAVQRDYATVEDQYGRLCWAYREPGAADWQLHGLWQ